MVSRLNSQPKEENLKNGNNAKILQAERTVTIHRSSVKFLKKIIHITQTSLEHLKSLELVGRKSLSTRSVAV